MPISSIAGKKDTLDWIKKISPRTILDVGAGIGTYSNLINYEQLDYDRLDAIEAWKTYIEDYDLNGKYDYVFNIDVRSFTDYYYDLVIFGDVLEHMTKDEAINTWENCSKLAKYAVISIPIVHSPQGHAHGNPYEEHIKDDWTAQEVLNTFPHIYKHEEYYNGGIGVFYAKFPESLERTTNESE